MKKCPFCHADIEDNARFCVFCMSSLQEKEKIENQPKNNKRWPYILAAFLLLALIFGISIFALSKNNANNSSGGSIPQSAVILDSDSSHSNSSSTNIPSTDNSSETTTDNSVADQTDNNSQHTSSEIIDNTDKTPSVTTPSNSTPVSSSGDTTTKPPSQSETPSQSEPSKSEDTDSNDQSNNDTPTQNTVTYTYRDATTADCFPTGYNPVYTPENVIVITGVNSAASDGIYIVPEKIDGKKVAAIMPNAFCDDSISKTVKKVVLPPTVRTIWQDAFSECYNLTDIYLQSEAIGIYESAFSDVLKRTGLLTIHCSRNCRNFDFYYYRNISNKYNAQYKEWNGGEIE